MAIIRLKVKNERGKILSPTLFSLLNCGHLDPQASVHPISYLDAYFNYPRFEKQSKESKETFMFSIFTHTVCPPLNTLRKHRQQHLNGGLVKIVAV